MNLEILEEARMNRKPCPLPISEKELCDRYEKVYTGAVNDVLRDMGYLYQTLPSTILPLREEMTVAGVAFTIKGSKNLIIRNEMEERAEMLEAIHENAICVWDTSEDDESAQWGEVMTMASIRRGCRGAVVDGGVRDTKTVLELGFPVFCKYRTNNGMGGRFRMVAYQVPVQIGRVEIHPGDIVFGDIDGVIVIPRDIAYEVLVKSEEVREKEVDIKQWVTDGMPPTEVVKRGGYF
ncbi:MAG TPA: RraA family protein [Firmicutes bacterium]|nr:RraA family protein [Bacillota bacterium]